MGQKLNVSASVPHNFFHLPTNRAQTAPEGVHRHKLGSRQEKFQVKVKGQGQMGPKLNFSDSVPHNSLIYQPIAPKRHQRKRIDTSLGEEKIQVKDKGQMGQKIDFSAGVPHNSFIYQPIVPKVLVLFGLDL